MEILINNHETWLICGGRGFEDQDMFDDVMSRLSRMWGCPRRIVHGGATGADAMADAWGRRLAIDVIACPADWEQYGRSAGHLRNTQMLIDHQPNRVIAFPGGRGTADMVRKAKAAPGTDVIEITPKSAERP